tara:strand:+ start:1802 stop:3370 length:1569 start_codon:yes stop_codon:yes gene_type:complete
MEYFLNKKNISILFCLLLATLIFFLQSNLNFTKYKLNWDEVDYANAASKGFINNYFDHDSIGIREFVNIGISKFNNSFENIKKTNFKINEKIDNFNLRHFHPPFPIYYLSIFIDKKEVGNIKNHKLRLSQLFFFFISIVILVFFIYIKSSNLKSYLLSLLLLIFFISNKSFISNYLNFNFHSFFSIIVLYHIISSLNYYYYNKIFWKINFILSISLLIITLETFPFILISSFIIYFIKKPKENKIKIFNLFKDFILSILVSIILFPSLIIKLTYLKTYLMYFYRIFNNSNKEYQDVSIFNNLYDFIIYNYLIIVFIIFLFLYSIITCKGYKNSKYFFIYSFVYSIFISPFMLSYTYIFPSLFILIFLTIIIYSDFNSSFFKTLILVTIITFGIFLNIIDYYKTDYKNSFNSFNKNIEYIIKNHLNDIDKEILIDGAHIYKFYIDNKNLRELNIYDLNNPSFYIRENYQNIDVSEQIINNRYDKIIIQSSRNYNKEKINFLTNNNYHLSSNKNGYKIYQLSND